MIFDRLERHRDLGLLILRLGFGLGFVFFHGLPKLLGGPEMWTGVGSSVRSFGIGFGHEWLGLAAALAETLGGLCIALGLFFRPAALVLTGVMIVAAANHLVSGQGTPAHAVKNAFLFAGLFLVGSGKYSVDERMRRGRG